jgi:hypothetical protein
MAHSNLVPLISLLDTAAIALVREWRKLPNEELHDLHSAQNIQVIRSEQKRGGACRTCGGGSRVACRACWRDLRERDHLGDQSLEWNIILKRIFVRVIRSQKKKGGTGDNMGDSRCVYRVWGGDLRERDNLEDLGVDWRTVLKWSFRTWDEEARTVSG